MSTRKAYTAPIWALLIILALTVAGGLALGESTLTSIHPPLLRIVFQYWIYPALLIGEGLVYYLFRYDMQARSWVWLQVACMAMVGLSFFAQFILIRLLPNRDWGLQWFAFVLSLYRYSRPVLFWTGLILGQLVFIKVLFENFFQPRSEAEAARDEPTGMLDDLED